MAKKKKTNQQKAMKFRRVAMTFLGIPSDRPPSNEYLIHEAINNLGIDLTRKVTPEELTLLMERKIQWRNFNYALNEGYFKSLPNPAPVQLKPEPYGGKAPSFDPFEWAPHKPPELVLIKSDIKHEDRPVSQSAPSQKAIDDFYESWEWKRLRYDFIKSKQRKCMCCNTSAEDGVKIVVDHRWPIRHHWQLRLDGSNLQLLCDDCNRGKGSRDTTDWRGQNAVS